jgi:multiple sugar transport system substrate-binding protein
LALQVVRITTHQRRYNGQPLFEFEVAPIPYNKDLPQFATAIQQGTNMSLTSSGTDQQKLASWLFLKFLNSHEVQLDFALATGYQPTRESVYVSNEYINFMNGFDADNKPLVDEMLNEIKSSKSSSRASTYIIL